MKLGLKIPPALAAKTVLFTKSIGRHHYFIALLVVCSGLGVAIYSVNQTLGTAQDQAYRSELLKKTVGTQFNKTTDETIAKIESLQRSTDQAGPQPVLPAGRINPFAE